MCPLTDPLQVRVVELPFFFFFLGWGWLQRMASSRRYCPACRRRLCHEAAPWPGRCAAPPSSTSWLAVKGRGNNLLSSGNFKGTSENSGMNCDRSEPAANRILIFWAVYRLGDWSGVWHVFGIETFFRPGVPTDSSRAGDCDW